VVGSRTLTLWASSLLVAAAVLACGLLAGCKETSPGASAGTYVCAAIARVDRLAISRVNPNPELHPAFPAKFIITARPRVQAVARALCALPVMPSGAFHCPPDFGMTYRLTFTAGPTAPHPVTVAASGCQEVHRLGQIRWTARTPHFWTTLGAAAGITNASLQTFSGTFGA
jgi:outer membrane murein-binding lipoprotein Lpp